MELQRVPCVVVLLLSLLCNGCTGLYMANNVTDIVVVVENGTVDAIVLDCPYILDEEDESGLVIKWYLDGNDHPIFQWIPNGPVDKPQLSDMEDIIDIEHVASADPLHRHRALRLLNPTTSLSGLYSCTASSYHGEASRDTRLVVYSLPSSLTLAVEELSPGGNVSVTCQSGPSYPESSLELSLDDDDQDGTVLEDSSVLAYWEDAYNSSIEALVEPTQWEYATAVHCRLSMAYTNFTLDETLKLQSMEKEDDEDNDDATMMEYEEELEEELEDIEPEQTIVADAATDRTVSGGLSVEAVPVTAVLVLVVAQLTVL